ncbi:MAG: hypothetical protein V3U50_01715 [Acidimicrobiia bacterium]
MSRRMVLLVLFFLAAAACSDRLGRDTPECAAGVTNSVVMQIQAVKGTHFVPCINDLKAGWTFNHVEAQSGLATFNIDSDRIGEPFVTIRTTATCDVSGAEPAISDERPIELYKDIVQDFRVRIVVVPEGPTEATLAAARSVVVDSFGLRLRDRAVSIGVNVTEGPTGDRIAAAHADGAHVITISIRDAEEGTVSLLLANESEEQIGGRLVDAIDEIEDRVSPPSYRGSWFYVFEGGCVEYRFDAAGPGVETVAGDVQGSFGFVDAEAIRQMARDAGYKLP